jgi:hypothetical protein
MPANAKTQRNYGRHVVSRRHGELLASHAVAGADGQRAMARLRSCACHALAAWLTALPTTHALVLKTEEFCAAMQHRLGLTPLPGQRCRPILWLQGPNHSG